MVVVVIVGFRNPGHVAACLRALAKLRGGPDFNVFVAENGGATAAENLIVELTAPEGPCLPVARPELSVIADHTRRTACFDLVRAATPTRVHVAEMAENLGYAGGVNAWLRALLAVPGWDAAWVLNPDTEPTPNALAELAAYTAQSGKGMVGAKLVGDADASTIQLRGIAWHHLRGSTVGVDWQAAAHIDAVPEEVISRLDAPSGASIYIQRQLIETIGLMDERFFLYYEDLDWGLRAKALDELGYADRAVVHHQGGSTIRTAANPRGRSPLAVFLEFRNRILLVRRHFPSWTAWTVLVQVFHLGRYLADGAFFNALAAFRGVLAGLRGQSGRPDGYVLQHRM